MTPRRYELTDFEFSITKSRASYNPYPLFFAMGHDGSNWVRNQSGEYVTWHEIGPVCVDREQWLVFNEEQDGDRCSARRGFLRFSDENLALGAA
jgi:hypothetical protein